MRLYSTEITRAMGKAWSTFSPSSPEEGTALQLPRIKKPYFWPSAARLWEQRLSASQQEPSVIISH